MPSQWLSKFLFLLATIMVLVVASCTDRSEQTKPKVTQNILLNVAAASSLTEAFQDIGNAFKLQHPNIIVNFNLAASGVLQRQIEQGANIDVFASAAKKPMDALENKNLLSPPSRKTFARNQLVVVTPLNQTSWLKKLSDLDDRRFQRLAIGNAATVPAGEYAKAALTKENLYTKLEQQKKLIFGDNVRQVLTYVEQGNVDAAIVYATDGAISKKIKIAFKISPNLTPPINYEIAVINQSQHPQQAQDLIDFVTASKGQQILQNYGFIPVTVP